MLTPEEIAILNRQPESYKEYLTARYSPLLMTLKDGDLIKRCVNFIEDAVKVNTNFQVKQPTDGKAERFMVDSLFTHLRKPKHNSWAIGEIELSIYKGSRRAFGDFFALNASVVISWTERYFELPDRDKALKAFAEELRLTPMAQTSESPIIKMDRSKQAVLNLFAHYREYGRFDGPMWAYYGVLCEIKGVKTLIESSEVRNQIEKESIEEMNARVKRSTASHHSRGEMKEAAELIRVANEGLLSPVHKNLCKEKALRWYFDKLIKEGKELQL